MSPPRGPPRFHLVQWTFVICSVAFSALLHSPAEVGGAEVSQKDDFAEFDLDEEEFEIKKAAHQIHDDEEEEAEVQDEEEEEFEEEEDEFEMKGTNNMEEERNNAHEDDGDEFAHFEDEEEFENYNRDEDGQIPKGKAKSASPPPPKTINIAKVPAHLNHNRWENYVLEILMAAGIVVYFLNFFTGKTKNQKIASTWFASHRPLLESNFALVGDDGAKDLQDVENPLVKDAEHLFSLWCSGRVSCEGMLVEIKLLKRQDLVSVISQLLKPSHDQVQIRVNMNSDDMDTFVFAMANKKSAVRLAKEMADLNTFCPEKRPAEKYGVPAHFCLMSEVSEVCSAVLDPKMVALLNKYPEAVDYIHVSDQFTGPRPTDDQTLTELPEGKKVIIFNFNIVLKNTTVEEAVENMKPLMHMVFYLVDKIKRYRLSREAKNKTEKNRSKVTEAFWKSIHASRMEKAQEERERKKREIKEKIKEIEDPEKQRKLEERELRREKKKAQPKMKQMKVKST